MSIDHSETLSRFLGPEKPDSADLGLCVHCGFCLNACPTYLALGVETDSPRGRLYLMRALDEGRIDLTPLLLQHFDQCLQCRACETACPSGVPYGQLMEATRAGLFARRRTQLGRSPTRRLLWNLIMRRVFPYPGRLRLLGFALRAYQQSGLQRVLRASGLLRLAGPRLAAAEALTPDATQPFFATADVRRYAPRGRPRARVAMLTGCVMPIFHPETHHATVRVLSRNGVEVTAPPAQRCCGALHAHSGDLETARDLARKTIDSFLSQEQQAAQRNISLTRPSSAHGQLNSASRSPKRMDAIVVNSAGCGSHMKEYAHLLRDDAAYADKAERLAGLVRDVNEYLAEIGIDPPTGARLHDGQTTAGARNRAVTYQDSCHLLHAQKVTDAPRALLRQIPGLELREMDHPERCCGSAGIYSVVQSKLSRDILQEKMQDINATDADQVCTANPGCMVQLDAGLRLHGAGPLKNGRSLHVVELLDESYRIAEGPTYADR